MSNREKELIYTPTCPDCVWHGLPVESADRARERSAAHWYGAHRVALAQAWDEGALWGAAEVNGVYLELVPGDNPYRVES